QCHMSLSFSPLGAPRPLPPFPTRRSSDLARAVIRVRIGDGKDRYAGIALGDGEGEPVVALGRGEFEIEIGGDAGHVARRNEPDADRKSTRLNSSHVKISYAVFCLQKKTMV